LEQINVRDIKLRIERDNYWWSEPERGVIEAALPRRVYFDPFKSLALNFDVKRATVLLGPRRVGKTVIIKQLINEAIKSGIDPKAVMYASIDAPIYSGFALERFLEYFPAETASQRRLVAFDEIQYLRDWEIHLKDLVDAYPNTKFIASGSAAAALRLKSKESGAGRFTEFMLPPLTFYEFLQFTKEEEKLIVQTPQGGYATTDIECLNRCFVDYLNFGGYPEAVLNPSIRSNAEQFIRNDIIDKVLLKDIPVLYGIKEIGDLHKLFSFLAYNAGNEASLENISQKAGISKPTITRYIDYLEAAFLIIKLSTVDDNCRTLQRQHNFKIYLNNPSMRSALFAPVSIDEHDRIGHLAECAVFSQWQHANSFRQLRYARWRNEGEVDIVYLGDGNAKPLWIGEIKWTDRLKTNFGEETRHMASMIKNFPKIASAFFTTRTLSGWTTVQNQAMRVWPTALYCYTVGRNITKSLDIALQQPLAGDVKKQPEELQQVKEATPG
jgi:uncharacterized protein